MLQATVSGVSDDEAYRVLMGALPLKEREKGLMEETRMLSHMRLTLLEGWPLVGDIAIVA